MLSFFISLGVSGVVIALIAAAALREGKTLHTAHWSGITEPSPFECESPSVMRGEQEHGGWSGYAAHLLQDTQAGESQVQPPVDGSWQLVDEAVEHGGCQPVDAVVDEWKESALAFAPMPMDPADPDYPLTIESLKQAAIYGLSQNWVTLSLLGTTKSTQSWISAVALFKQVKSQVDRGVLK